MTLLISFILMVLLVSFLCSMLESILLSTTIPYLIKVEIEGMKGAVLMKKWKNNIETALSSILSLNTIANTVGAAGVGAQVIKVFGELYLGLASAILTLLILLFAEVVPKSIGTHYWKKLIPFAGKTISVMVVIMYPLVLISRQISRLFSKKGDSQTVSKEELSVLAHMGHKEGVFDDTQNKIIQNIIKLNDVTVNQVMTPRTVLLAAQADMPLAEFLSKSEFLHFSRIPIYDKTIDDIEGYVLRYDLIENYAPEKANLPIKTFKRNLAATYEHNTLIDVWEFLLSKKEHFAVVVSEYGGVEGIITLEDIIETIIGLEIVDERDNSADMQSIARERWKQRQAKYNLHVSEN